MWHQGGEESFEKEGAKVVREEEDLGESRGEAERQLMAEEMGLIE